MAIFYYIKIYKKRLAKQATTLYNPITGNESARRFAAADEKGGLPPRPAYVESPTYTIAFATPHDYYMTDCLYVQVKVVVKVAECVAP